MTLQQQTDAYQFFIVAFGAAPGTVYMDQLNDAYGAGMTSKQIVNIYTTKDQFTSRYPDFLANNDFATSLINNVVGNSATAAAKAEAVVDITAALTSGFSRGDVIFQVFSNLANKDRADVTWGNTAKQFDNQVAVAKFVTQDQLVASTDLAVLRGFLNGVTQDVATVQTAKDAALGANGGTFSLTAGVDNIVGTAGNDTINGSNLTVTDLTVTGLDVINGGAGTDTLNISDVAGASVNLALVAVSNVENLVLTSAAGLAAGAANVSSIAGLTSAAFDLRAVAANQAITAAGTTAVSLTAVVTGASDLTINGGSTVTAAVNNTVDNSGKAVVVAGGAATTAVTVTQTAATAAHASAVTINDKNAGDDAVADTITTVTLSGLTGGVATVNSDALATLNLSNSNKNVTIDNDTVGHALALNLNGVTGGTISDVKATSVTVTNTTTASSGITVTADLAATITFAGDKAISTSLGATQAPNLAITSTNSAGTTILTALDTDVTFTGGAGADAVNIAAHTKSVNMGAGNDTVTATAALGAGGAVAGGDGTDTLVANAASFALTGFTGFETLGLGTSATGAYIATGFANLTQGGVTAAVTYNNVAAGTGLTITASPGFATAYNLANITGTTDALNLTVSSASAVDTGTVTANGVETITIASNDTDTTQHQNTVSVASSTLKSVVVTGNAGVALAAADLTITSVDASALSLTGTVAAGAGFTFTSGAVTDNLVVKGSATGGDTIDLSAVVAAGKTTAVTVYSGTNTVTGSGLVDTITGGTGADTINAGAGRDVIVGGGGADQISAGAGADQITVSGSTYTIVQAAGASGTNTSTTIQTAQLTSTFDVVFGAAAGGKINLGNAGIAGADLNLTGANLAGFAADDSAVFARGSYDAAAGTFTYAANGADSALTYDADVVFDQTFETIILVGFVAGSTTAAAAGVITLG
jgi:S-layer protein